MGSGLEYPHREIVTGTRREDPESGGQSPENLCYLRQYFSQQSLNNVWIDPSVSLVK